MLFSSLPTTKFTAAASWWRITRFTGNFDRKSKYFTSASGLAMSPVPRPFIGETNEQPGYEARFPHHSLQTSQSSRPSQRPIFDCLHCCSMQAIKYWSERRHKTNGTLCLPSSGLRRCLMQGAGATCRQKLLPFLDQFLGSLSNLTLPLAKCVHIFPNPCFLYQEENMVPSTVS